MISKSILFIAFVLTAAAPLQGFGDPIEEIEGASQKEREIRWLWKYLGEFVESCERSGAECASDDLKSVVTRLRESLPSKPQATTSAWGQRLKFVSEAQSPGLFTSTDGENHRLAVTELRMNADIYINVDRVDLPPARWVGILVHEAVHHLGLPDDVSRLPDRLGAAVATHVEKNWHESFLGEFGHPGTGMIVFNEPLQDRLARVFVNVNTIANLSVTTDHDLRLNANKPVCNAEDKFIGQWTGENLWRVLNLRGDKGRARIRGSAVINNTCRNSSGQEYQVKTNLMSILDLVFNSPFDPFSAWWELPSYIDPTSASFGYAEEAANQIDFNRTFAILSVSHSGSEFLPGEAWRSRIIVKSTDGFRPGECGVFFSASQWMFSRSANEKIFDVFNTCRLTALGDDRWQIDTHYTFSETAQPDLFAVSLIYFSNGETDRYAVPLRPQFVKFKNPSASPRMSVSAWRVSELDPATNLMGQPVVGSFRVEYDKPFWLEVDLFGPQKILRQYFDFDFIVNSAMGLVLMPWNPATHDMGEMILRTEQVPIPGGTRLRFQLKLPRTMDSLTNLGFKLRRISVETDDYSWAELELPNFNEAWFLTDTLL